MVHIQSFILSDKLSFDLSPLLLGRAFELRSYHTRVDRM